jgi:hypothetical protein
MTFLEKYEENIIKIVNRTLIEFDDEIWLGSNYERTLIQTVNQQNNNIFGNDLCDENVNPIRITNCEDLNSWNTHEIAFIHNGQFYLIKAMNMNHVFYDLPHLTTIAYEVYTCKGEFKYFRGFSFPFEITTPEGSSRSFIYIPFTEEELELMAEEQLDYPYLKFMF